MTDSATFSTKAIGKTEPIGFPGADGVAEGHAVTLAPLGVFVGRVA